MAKQKDEVMSAQSLALVPIELQASLAGVDAHAGLEGVRQEDLKLPFYNIVQKQSKLVDKDATEYREDAEIGDFYESAVAKTLHKELSMVILKPIFGWSEFKPQDQGGGFVGYHNDGTAAVAQATDKAYMKKVRANGNELQGGYKLLVLTLDSGKPTLGWFTSSGMGQQNIKDFLANAALQAASGVPMFFKKYAVTTSGVKTDYGTTRVPTFTDAGFNDAAVIEYAKEALSRFDVAKMTDALNSLKEESTGGGGGPKIVDISAHQ